ncbi:MAG: hypothetical protein WBQ60_01430 [Asticcacaulis sp.]
MKNVTNNKENLAQTRINHWLGTILLTAILALGVYSVISGKSTWIETAKLDWIWVLLLLYMLPNRFAICASLLFLPIAFWLELQGLPSNWQFMTIKSWRVWVPVILWISIVGRLLFDAFKGQFFSKPEKTEKT